MTYRVISPFRFRGKLIEPGADVPAGADVSKLLRAKCIAPMARGDLPPGPRNVQAVMDGRLSPDEVRQEEMGAFPGLDDPGAGPFPEGAGGGLPAGDPAAVAGGDNRGDRDGPEPDARGRKRSKRQSSHDRDQ